MPEKDIETFYPASQQEWRDWLEANHQSKAAVWLVYYKAKSGKPSISWSNAVDEALCFGWIDSTHKSLDQESSIQFFSKRKPKSTWSKVNKDKIQELIASGKMTPAGLKCVEIAQQNGSWSILDEVEALIIPADLEERFKTQPSAKEAFLTLGKSAKKSILHRLVMAKLPDTRAKRIDEIMELLGGKGADQSNIQ
jgi:uncharacterized protein YdeI (YjbR/CyaY-like superfamily)